MAVSVRYPAYPGGVDVGSILGAFDSAFDRGREQKYEREAQKALEQYGNSLYGQQGQPQSLSALQSLIPQPQQPQNAVQRSPLSAPVDPATARVEQAFAAQGQGGEQPLSSNAIAGRFIKTVRDGGVTNPYALAAIAATGKRESGFDPKNAVSTWSDPSQSGQAGTAGGIMSWRGPRLQALQQFAQQNGDDPRAPSPETQAKFLLSEDPSLIQSLQQARSPQEAQQMMNNAWRFAGYNQQGGETAARMQLAEQYAPQFGGQGQAPSQQALEGMAVGQSAPMGAQPGAQVANGGMPSMDPASMLPPREAMIGLLKNPTTRPLGIQLAQSAMKLRMGQNDPQAQIEYQIAVEKLKQLQNPQADPGDVLAREKFEWEKTQGGKPPNIVELFDEATGQPYKATWDASTGQYKRVGGVKARSGMQLTTNPDGTVTMTEGSVSGMPKLTEAEGRNSGFYGRGVESHKLLNNLEGEGTSLWNKTVGNVPVVGNYARTEDAQKYDQAKRDFINAVLRRESGAVISPNEFANAEEQYFPQPGDGDEVIAQKRRNRETTIQGLKISSGQGAQFAVPQSPENDYKARYGLD